MAESNAGITPKPTQEEKDKAIKTLIGACFRLGIALILIGLMWSCIAAYIAVA